ncbi:endo-1,4-beta-xylanase [Clostridium sp. E02]|uniref:endo-1,4-beta-xylanase n=1 Tax=Clostridium sp. E02 TaxID=2487134 RepID=UPI000F51E71E|nr:endo-1,4-beta-xylanase [Clostridium sp. E02]
MRRLLGKAGAICMGIMVCLNMSTGMVWANDQAAKSQEKKEVKIESLTPIKDIYKGKFLIGNIYNSINLTGVDKDIILHHYNVLTPENMMKPDAMQRKKGVFTYESADAMTGFCQENGLQTVGHTLAWHGQTPDWMNAACSREEAIGRLKNHIANVAGHYNGKLLSWDVVNEAIKDGARLPEDGNWKSCLRDTPWLRNIGDDYIELAFQFAHEADPSAKLYYNDYNLNDNNKAEIAAAMFSDLKKKGIPIDGIGMQAHYSTTLPIATVKYSLELFKKAGAEISITELDVGVSKAEASGLTKDQEIAQGQMYAQLFKLYNQYSDSIKRVTFWGYVDTKSWRSENFPCLFDGNYKAKEAYYAVADPDGYLNKHPLEETPEPNTISAVKGTPVIDGTVDEIWNQAKEESVRIMTMAWQGATGTVKTLWDEKNIYVLVHVKDKTLNTDSENAYEQDSVELFLDENNDKSYYYQKDDGQFRVSCKNVVTFGSNGMRDGFKSAIQVTGDGYLVEARIPLTSTAKKGNVMGFDIQINDSNERGERISVAKFNDDSDNSWQSTARWGNLLLKD